MITKDEIMQIGQIANLDIECSFLCRNDRFPDRVIVASIVDTGNAGAPLLYIDLFEESQSNEGYNKFLVREAEYNYDDGGLNDQNLVSEESQYIDNLYPFPNSGLTEDMMLTIARNAGISNSNLNIFLAGPGNRVATGSDNQGTPNMAVLYGKYSSENGGVYQFSELPNFDQRAKDIGNFYNINGQIMNEDQYNQYINDNH